MSDRQDITTALIATPGMTMRQVSEATGLDDTNAVSAHLSQMTTLGKLRRDDKCPPGYWPTPLATLDLRAKGKTPAQVETLRQAALDREAARLAKREAPAKRAAPKRKPSLRDAARIVDAADPPIVRDDPAPQLVKAPKIRGETITDFQNRGGVIEKLPPHYVSNPLRFDHSNGSALNRPVRRTRVAVAP